MGMREWFSEIGKTLFKDAKQDGLFMLAEDSTLTPRPLANAPKWTKTDLVACGRFIALCIGQKQAVPLPLGGILTKFMCGEQIKPRDVQRLDPQFFKNRIQAMLKPDGVKEMEEILGEKTFFMSAPTQIAETPVEMKPGGKNIEVTEENKTEYCQLLCEFYLCEGIRHELQYLLQGFHDVIPSRFLKRVNHRELSLMINGVQDIDAAEWEKYAEIDASLTAAQECVNMFWAVVRDLSKQEKALLLQFSTGSACLPPSGFKDLEPVFKLSLSTDGPDHLPHSHTCFNQLLIPRYPNKEVAKNKIMSAIYQAEGFAFM